MQSRPGGAAGSPSGGLSTTGFPFLYNALSLRSYRSTRPAEGGQFGQPELRKTRLQTVAYIDLFKSNPLCGGGGSPFPNLSPVKKSKPFVPGLVTASGRRNDMLSN